MKEEEDQSLLPVLAFCVPTVQSRIVFGAVTCQSTKSLPLDLLIFGFVFGFFSRRKTRLQSLRGAGRDFQAGPVQNC